MFSTDAVRIARPWQVPIRGCHPCNGSLAKRQHFPALNKFRIGRGNAGNPTPSSICHLHPKPCLSRQDRRRLAGRRVRGGRPPRSGSYLFVDAAQNNATFRLRVPKPRRRKLFKISGFSKLAEYPPAPAMHTVRAETCAVSRKRRACVGT